MVNITIKDLCKSCLKIKKNAEKFLAYNSVWRIFESRI